MVRHGKETYVGEPAEKLSAINTASTQLVELGQAFTATAQAAEKAFLAMNVLANRVSEIEQRLAFWDYISRTGRSNLSWCLYDPKPYREIGYLIRQAVS